MKKLIGYGLAAAALAAPLYAAADPVNWTQWTGQTGTVSQNGVAIDVAIAGHVDSTSTSDYYTNHPATYTSAEVDNGPANHGTLVFAGGDETVHHISFSTAVVNPYIAFVSLGASGTEASFNFVNATDITLVSSGAGPWGNGAVTVNGGVVSAQEGNGVIRLNGTFTDLYFTTPTYEYWYGATVGVAAAVPEPGAWAMLLAGGAALALAGRRRSGQGKLQQPA